MVQQGMTRRFTALLLTSLIMPLSAHAVDAATPAAYQPVTRTDLVQLPPEAQIGSATLSPVVNNAPSPAPNVQAGTRAVAREGASQISSATGISSASTGRLANAAANGNIEGVARREATNTVRREGSAALASGTGIARGDTNALVNGALNGNIQQAGTRIATREGSNTLARETGLSRGLTRSIVGGLAGGLGNSRGSRPSSPSFKQKNDYVAASDDGIIRYTSDGRLSSALRNSGFGGSGRFSLTPEGILRDATGQIAGRMDRTTGKLFDAAGKEIASNSLLGNRIQSDIRTSASSAGLTTVASTAAAAGSIPSGFNNSNWDAATRQSEWAKLTPNQQQSWLKEAALKDSAPAAVAERLAQTSNNRGEVPTL